MNKNLELLMDKILNDESLAEEFVEKQTMDEMYEFCTSVVGGYTEEEFDSFVCEMLELADENYISPNLELQLDSVAGGKMMPGAKIAAAALATLTAVSGTGIAFSSVSAAKALKAPVSQSQSVSEGKWQKFKNFCKKNKKWLTGAGVTAAVLTGVAIIKNNNKKGSRVEVISERRLTLPRPPKEGETKKSRLKALEAPRQSEAPTPPEAPKPPKAPKPPEAPQPAEAPQPPEAPQPAEAPKPPEAPQPAEAPKPPEAPQPAEAPQPPEPPKAPGPREKYRPTGGYFGRNLF